MRANIDSMDRSIGLRQVFLLAWPIMISMISHTAMTVADTFFVGHLGTAPLAGMGVGSVASFVLLATGFGVMGGLRVLVAQATGAADRARADELAWQGLWLALGLGVIGLLLAPLALPVARLFGGSEEVSVHAAAYLSVRSIGTGPALLNLALSSWFQGRGDTRSPMVAAVLANLLNIGLDPWFIHGGAGLPAFGVAGAAWATVLAQGLGFVLLLWLGRRELRVARWAPRLSLLAETMRVGAPMALRGALSVGGFAIFVALLARAGDAHLGAHVIVLRIISLSFLPGHAVGEAAGVLIGQALGAGRPERAREAFRAGTRLAVGLMGTLSLLFVLLPAQLVGLFQPSAEVLEIAVQLMLIGAAFQIIDAVAMVNQGVLNGAGDTRFTMVAGVATMWLVNLPLGWWLALHLELGAVGAWLALTAEILAFALLTAARVRGDRWLLQLDPARPPPEAQLATAS